MASSTGLYYQEIVRFPYKGTSAIDSLKYREKIHHLLIQFVSLGFHYKTTEIPEKLSTFPKFIAKTKKTLFGINYIPKMKSGKYLDHQHIDNLYLKNAIENIHHMRSFYGLLNDRCNDMITFKFIIQYSENGGYDLTLFVTVNYKNQTLHCDKEVIHISDIKTLYKLFRIPPYSIYDDLRFHFSHMTFPDLEDIKRYYRISFSTEKYKRDVKAALINNENIYSKYLDNFEYNVIMDSMYDDINKPLNGEVSMKIVFATPEEINQMKSKRLFHRIAGNLSEEDYIYFTKESTENNQEPLLYN